MPEQIDKYVLGGVTVFALIGSTSRPCYFDSCNASFLQVSISICSLSHSPYEFPIPGAINFPAVWSLFSKVHVQIAHFSSLPLRKVVELLPYLIGQKVKKWKHQTKFDVKSFHVGWLVYELLFGNLISRVFPFIF